MIVQITITRDECFLLKEMLPIWQKYTDGFVFMVDCRTTDNTRDFLEKNKEKYNILEIIEWHWDSDPHEQETHARQTLFDAGRKYSNKIICLDTDEYLDGSATKEQLEKILDNNPDTLFYMQWIQYTGKKQKRVDSVWRNVFHDRVGSYIEPAYYNKAFMHVGHLPSTKRGIQINPEHLFIAHLQWLDKRWVGIKQYYWKVWDYVNHKELGVNVINKSDYDVSVNNFNWEYENVSYPLKINEKIYSTQDVKSNTKLKYIVEQTQKHNVPNLGDWGMGIYEYAAGIKTDKNTKTENSIPMYFCTAADDVHYYALLNLIGSIHRYNFNELEEFAIFNLGLKEEQIKEINNIQKVKIYNVEKTNPLITEPLYNSPGRWIRGLFSWKPVVIKQALQLFPYVLYVDAGTTFLKPINNLFKHIKENNYFIPDCGHSIRWMTTQYIVKKMLLQTPERNWLLNDDTLGIDAGFLGVTKNIEKDFIDPVYEFSKEIQNFVDDGTCPEGWGTGRHDQTLFSLRAQELKLTLSKHDRDAEECFLHFENHKEPFHITHQGHRVKPETYVFRCRRNVPQNIFDENIKYIKTKN